jgi:hypothetical protein
MISKGVADTNLEVFCLQRPEFEPTIYHSQVEHAKHYTTEAIKIL